MLRAMIHPLSLTAMTALFIALLMAVYPNETLYSSLRGLSIWWQVLFPALFPFFVISELMLGLGIVHFLGKLLDPFMRPMFRIPGIGGFVVAMGYMSGYPVGARLTSQLWEQRLITRNEGERLVAFTTTSDPIFLIGAVSVGFFHNVALAPLLAAAHYGSGFAIGLLMRFHGSREDRAEQTIVPGDREHASFTSSQLSPIQRKRRTRSRLYAALHAMHEARLLDGRSLGKLLQDSVQSALKLMMVVGGLVVFFSVVMELLTHAGLVSALAEGLRLVMGIVGLPPALADASVYGLFEVTLGSRAAGMAGTGLMHQAAIAAWVLSWAGLSVHAQVASLISRTTMRYRPFFMARLLHGFLAAALVYLLWGWLAP
ncbi:MAG: sporulation integral rane protein YlbJ [Paenibacillus sp.]|nr:sporulation integral rane protein YlbJ [Paenibacillus sp.]